jgi:predicted O-methyltransferase YrrM
MSQPRFLFGGTVFLASFLLFLVEPMAAKQLLPIFGGSAAVWITCLVFFQTALLCAYLYAHWLARHPRGANLHLALLFAAAAAAIVYALHAPNQIQTAQNPVLAIFTALGISIGLPFLVLGATSPLLQVWLARLANPNGTGKIPYHLFALSNLASLLALGLYPTLIEPYFPLRAQRIAWAIGFAIFAILAAFLTTITRRTAAEPPEETELEAEIPKSPRLHKLLWILLPMGAAMQLSAVTSYLTANIAPIPLLWILPLAVYLVTLILAFQFPKFAPRWLITRLLVILLASLGYMLMQVDTTLPIRIGIAFFLIELLVAGLFCHGEAYALRPQRPSETTLFYLLFAAGGALGSFLIGIAAPLIFRFNFDLALVFFVTALLALAVNWFVLKTGWGPKLLWSAASILLLLLVFFIQTAYQRNTPVAVRNFYGSLRVKETLGYPPAQIRVLSNGNIQHGTQIFSAELRRIPTTYYAEDSGVGIALRHCCLSSSASSRPRNIGVIGLGAGTLAAYGQPDDRIRFYEINPAVIPIAQNIFTYIRDAQTLSGTQISIVEGDARTSLTRELAQTGSQQFDVLVIDAFSGDAIPLHLLTTEAVALYQKHLKPGGILAFHISNQHVDLEPEIAQLAQSAGMQAMQITSPINDERGEFAATWMLVTTDASFFAQPAVATHAKPPHQNPRVRPWTDDYSSLLPILRW